MDIRGDMTLKALFDRSTVQFSIPPYQRAYSWERDKHLNVFLDDIDRQVDRKNYFMGTFLFQKEPANSGIIEKMHIVDGQQRLTTIVVFLNELLSILRDAKSSHPIAEMFEVYISKNNRQKLITIPEDNTFFLTYIIGSDTNPLSFTTPSQKRLYEAKVYFKSALKNFPIDKLEKYLNRINETKLLAYTVTDESEATLIFETTNDRGKKLTDLEAIKGYLMHKLYLSANKDPVPYLEQVQSHFTEIYRCSERIEDVIADDDILRYHFIAFEHWSENEYYAVKDNIKSRIQTFFDKDNSSALVEKSEDNDREPMQMTITSILSLAQRIKESFAVMEMLLSLKKTHTAIQDLFALGRIATFYPLLLKTYKINKKQNKNLLNFDRIAMLVEMFAFKAYGIASKRADTGVSYFYRLARDFKGDFEALINELKLASTERWDVDKLFKDHLDYKFFYEYGIDARYLLWKYENQLRSKPGCQYSLIPFEDFISNDSKTGFSSEHIACQKDALRNYQYNIDDSSGITNDWIDHLGNLVLDCRSPNSSKGAKGQDKKEADYYSKAPFISQSMVSSFLIDGKWTIDSIKNRAAEIKSFAIANWNPMRIN